MTWSIKDRAGDMERGYPINRTACKNTRKVIESTKTKNSDKSKN